MQTDSTSVRGIIASYVAPTSLGLLTRAALTGLGYRVVQGASVGRFDDPRFRPGLRIVDDRHLHRLPTLEADPATPVIVLSGPRPRPVGDPRVRGQLTRPAELADLYPLVQQCLEPTPRTAPRVGTQLTARVAQTGRRFVARLASLSSHGCLLDDARDISPGAGMNVEFDVPGSGLLMTRARCVYETQSGYGLRFDATTEPMREAIDAFVTQRLALRPALA